MSTCRLTIVGVGAMACLFGGYLSAADKIKSQLPAPSSRLDVLLFGHWAAQLEALRRRPLIIRLWDGRSFRQRLKTTFKEETIPVSDVILVLTKQYQNPQFAESVSSRLAPEGVLITLQNGLGAGEAFRKFLPEEQIFAGVTYQAAYLDEPGQLIHTGAGMTFLPDRLAHLPVGKTFLGWLRFTGIPLSLTPHIGEQIWAKTAVNAVINPLTALLNIANGQLIEDQQCRKIISRLCKELSAVAAVQEAVVDPDALEAQVAAVCRASKINYSSMLRDVQQDRPTEVEVILGKPLQIAREAKLNTPVLSHLYQLMQERQKGRIIKRDNVFETVIPG